MRVLMLLAVIVLFVGCSPDRSAITVEDRTPIVGANAVTTEALGVETLGGVFTPIIMQGTKTPCSVSEVFSTAADEQDQIIVSLFRGSERIAARNRSLGQFQVVDIPKAPRGVPKVEITFAISERSISLSARDLARRKDLKVVRLSRERSL